LLFISFDSVCKFLLIC